MTATWPRVGDLVWIVPMVVQAYSVFESASTPKTDKLWMVLYLAAQVILICAYTDIQFHSQD